jgi:hypothetical protein
MLCNVMRCNVLFATHRLVTVVDRLMIVVYRFVTDVYRFSDCSVPLSG